MNRFTELLSQKDLNFSDLKTQFFKDLQMSGIDIDFFEAETTPEVFWQWLKHLVSDLLSYHTEAFNRLMYRVDIPEKELQKLQHTCLPELSEHIAYLILKREMQKLVFKKQFGS